MKLKTVPFRYKTESAQLSFDVTINVSKEGEFYFNSKEIPKEIMVVSKDQFNLSGMTAKHARGDYQNSLIYARSLNDVNKAIQAAIEKFENSITHRDELKVIVYKFDLRGVKKIGDDGPEYFGVDQSQRRWGNYNKQDSLHIQLDWEILRKITDKSKLYPADNPKIMYLTLDGSQRHPGDEERVIKWTKEREDWFRSLEHQMRAMMFNIEKFMGLEEKQLQKIIASKQLLLAASQK